MIEICGDIFEYTSEKDCNVLRCITTNGILDKKGHLVMGAGLAKQAKLKFPNIPEILGNLVNKFGNHVHIVDDYCIASFPTKNHWKDKSDINLIARSALELASLTKKWDYVLLTRPGCGLGGLEWSYVKSIIESILNQDKFIIIDL